MKDNKNSTLAQSINIRRVSLQLSSTQAPSRKSSLGHSRVSLCYSANLKKRSEALNAQKAIFESGVQQKSQAFLERSASNSKNGSPLRTKLMRETKAIPVTKIGENNRVIQARATNLQTIEIINNRSLYKLGKEKLAKTRKLRTDTMPNYDTIVSRDMDRYDHGRREGEGSQRKVTQTDCHSFVLSGVKTQSFREVVLNSQELRPKQNRKFSFIHNQNQKLVKSSQFKASTTASTGKSQNNRILTAPSANNIDPIMIKSNKVGHAVNKETYKTNMINLSQHFKNYEEKNTIFPSCRKMAISSVNKYYEICVQDIKNSELKRKCANYIENPKESQHHDIVAVIENKKQPHDSNQKEENRKRIESAPTYKKSLQKTKLQPEQKKTYPAKNNFLTTKNIYRQETEQNHIWLQIKNTLEDEQMLGYSLCKKKLLQQRLNTSSTKKQTNDRYTLKKCATDINHFEDEYGNKIVEIVDPLTVVKLGRNKSMKCQRGKAAVSKLVGPDDGAIGAWDTLGGNGAEIIQNNNFFGL